jgi:hypothetical protein
LGTDDRCRTSPISRGSGSSDSDGTIVRYDWSFGDGTSAHNGGRALAHVYTRAGSHKAALTVTHDRGCSTRFVFTGQIAYCNGTAAATTTRTIHVPELTRLRVSPATFSLAGRGFGGGCVKATATHSTAPSCNRPIDLKVTYELDTPARVTFTVALEQPGRIVAGRCVKLTRNRAHRAKCTLLAKLTGAITQAGRRGANRFDWRGRIGRHALAAGTYRLTATAAGGRPRTVTFRIV